jgi:hypothetical protein
MHALSLTSCTVDSQGQASIAFDLWPEIIDNSTPSLAEFVHARFGTNRLGDQLSLLQPCYRAPYAGRAGHKRQHDTHDHGSNALKK